MISPAAANTFLHKTSWKCWVKTNDSEVNKFTYQGSLYTSMDNRIDRRSGALLPCIDGKKAQFNAENTTQHIYMYVVLQESIPINARPTTKCYLPYQKMELVRETNQPWVQDIRTSEPNFERKEIFCLSRFFSVFKTSELLACVFHASVRTAYGARRSRKARFLPGQNKAYTPKVFRPTDR